MVAEQTGPSAVAAEIAALLGWWKLAGVDTLVGETPTDWFVGETPTDRFAQAEPAPAVAASAAARPISIGPDPFAAVATLADLAAMVRADWAGVPFADGNPASGIMIMGESPSAEDLRTGRPFTGPAGQLLDRMLAAIGLDRTSCYIGLVVPRRRIPGTPSPDDIAADLPLARAHVRLAAPRLLLLMGGTASQALSGDKTPIGKLRGTWLNVEGAPALATFNPAYLLRRPEDKALAWADLLAFKRRMHA
jgi:DNA polymerase